MKQQDLGAAPAVTPTPRGDDESRYGFAWGPLVVERVAHIEGRGYSVQVRPRGKYEPAVEVFVSEQGRSWSVWPRGKVNVKDAK
jgi:hypothetical protein